MRKVLGILVPALTILATTSREPGWNADAHMHVLSPAGAVYMREHLGRDRALEAETRDAAAVLADLDSADTRKATIISEAYTFATAELTDSLERERVRWENDWAARQAARDPDRLFAFCSVNPLRAYAITEVERCARRLHVAGLKMSFAASGVDLDRWEDLTAIRAVIAAADAERLALLIHIVAPPDGSATRQAQRFTQEVLPLARHVPVQVAHAGGFGGYSAQTDTVLGMLLQAARRRRPALYVDLAWVLDGAGPAGEERLAQRIRAGGARHVLLGSDWPAWSTTDARAALTRSLRHDPATLARIAHNFPSYMR